MVEYLHIVRPARRKHLERKNAGKELEDFVHQVYLIMLSNEHLKNVKIEKNHIEIGRSGAKYEFDVFYEIKIAGLTHKVGIECKNHNRKITKEVIQGFKSKLDDCVNVTGLMISTIGYQEGAKALGRYYGIELITIDDLPNIYQLSIEHSTNHIQLENTYNDQVSGVIQSKDRKNINNNSSHNNEKSFPENDSTHKLEKILNWIYSHPMKTLTDLLIAVIASVMAGIILKILYP